MKQIKYSIIIPVFQEQQNINKIIQHLKNIENKETKEIIIVDGDTKGSTINKIIDNSIIKLKSKKSRAKQMNKGASVAIGDVLLFLHADTMFPKDALDLIGNKIKIKYLAGAFKLKINSEKIIFKIIAWTINLRIKFTRIPYGDHAIFIKKDYFKSIGGYKDISLMEDVELMKRIKKDKKKICIINKYVVTSPRRWLKYGIVKTTLKNYFIRVLYTFGVKEDKLAKIYYN